MARYIVLPIKRDPIDAEETITERIQQDMPGWTASDGDPMTILMRGVAVLYSEVAELATQMSAEAFRYYGRTLTRIPPVDESVATGTVTFTATSTNGWLVPEGTEVGGRNETGELVGFRTLTAIAIPAGSLTGGGAVEALVEGEAGNGVQGVGELGEYFDFLEGVAFDSPTAGGQEAEADDLYLDRLTTELQLQSPRPILPRDFAVLARRLAGIGYRATAIDGLNPADDTTGNERMVAVALVDSAGAAASGTVLSTVRAQMEEMREANFQVPTINATYSTIDAHFTATAFPGWDAEVVRQQGIDRLTDYLSPARWGSREDTGEELEWVNHPVVRYLEMAAQLDRVEGLDEITSLAFSKAGQPLGTADVSMSGYAPLPLPGEITGVVTAT